MSTVIGTAGNDTLTGTGTDDVIKGVAGNDSIAANDGNDALLGGFGDDRLDGGAGNFDWLIGGPGNDTLDGGVPSDLTFNVDIAVYDGGAAVSADLRTGAASQAGFTDTLIRIDAIFSGDGADGLRGADGDPLLRGETLRGALGNDTIDGGAGVDTAEFVRPRSEYTVTKVNDSTLAVRDDVPGNGDEGTDTLTGIERIVFADQMLSFGARAEELARVAFVLWNPAIVGSTALFARGLSFYDVGYDFATMSVVALQFWTADSDTQLAQRLIDNSGSTKTAAQLLATMAAAGGDVEGRAAALREIALDPATTQRIEESNIRTVGLVSDHFVPGFGTLFALLPEG
jgi:Ca2+-binding RTX toxin-like protein